MSDRASPCVFVRATWELLSSVQQECLRALARATLGWGYRWGREFEAAFVVTCSTPEELPVGIAMYNGTTQRGPTAGDIVVLFRSPDPDAILRDAMLAAAQGALIIAEPDPLVAQRFDGVLASFSSPSNLVETIFGYLDQPTALDRVASVGTSRAEEIKHPLISIIIFVYNGATYIREAIESALAQDYNRYEVIVIDDGSTDETPTIVRSMESPRLRYERQKHAGAPFARNHGLRLAKGEFIIWLGADDVLRASCVSSHVEVLRKHPAADVVYGDLVMCDADLRELKPLQYDEWSGRENVLPAAMIRTNVIPDGGTLIRKECFNRVGDYNIEFPRAHDYEWWTRLIGHARFKHNSSTIYSWRWHGKNLGAGSGKTIDLSFEARIVEGLCHRFAMEQLFPELSWKDRQRERIEALAHAKVAEILASYGDAKGAIAHLEAGAECFPLPEIHHAIQSLRHQQSEPASLPDSKTATSQTGDSTDQRKVQIGGLSVTYLITNILGVTGGNQTLLRQANALVERGHQVTIVTRSSRPSWCSINADVVHVGEREPMWKAVPRSDVVISTYFLNTAELVSVKAKTKVYFAQGDQFIFDDTCRSAHPDVKKLHGLMKEMSRVSYLIPGMKFIAKFPGVR